MSTEAATDGCVRKPIAGPTLTPHLRRYSPRTPLIPSPSPDRPSSPTLLPSERGERSRLPSSDRKPPCMFQERRRRMVGRRHRSRAGPNTPAPAGSARCPRDRARSQESVVRSGCRPTRARTVAGAALRSPHQARPGGVGPAPRTEEDPCARMRRGLASMSPRRGLMWPVTATSRGAPSQ